MWNQPIQVFLMKSAALSPATCTYTVIKRKRGRWQGLRTDHNRWRIRVAGCDPRHDARVGHPYTSHSSDSQLIVNHGHWIIRRSHFAGSRLMILWCSVMTNRTFPVSVAAELEMLAILHGSSVQLETIPIRHFRRIHENKSRYLRLI